MKTGGKGECCFSALVQQLGRDTPRDGGQQINGGHRSQVTNQVCFSPRGQKVTAEAEIAGGGDESNDTHHEKTHDECKD